MGDVNYGLPDIQHSLKPKYEIPIHQVGVENIKCHIILESKNGGMNRLLSNVSMSTDLSADKKGISMSMLLRTLVNYLEVPLKHKLIHQILEQFKTAVETESDNSFIRFEFELPMLREAPISKMTFPQFYKCAFEGRLTKGHFRFFQRVKIQYASYCPCSASLCNHLQENGNSGYPHAQRSFANILVEMLPDNVLWLEEIIDLIEGAVKTAPIPILRRADEQEYARIAHENPMFVEDAIRIISNALNNESKIYDWIVKCVHEESIHTSEAISINWKGIENGFDGLLFL